MIAKTLSLLVTYQCTASCKQCCFGCNPTKKQRIQQHRLLSYIDQAADLGLINVVFTGGECFLLGRDLTEAVQHAADRGLATRCVTNAFWATSPKAAALRLKELVDAGLKELNISTGDFHQEYIPVRNVEHGAIAAYELGLGLVIMVETYKNRSFTAEVLLKNTLIGEVHLEDPGGMQIKEAIWIPIESHVTIEHEECHRRGPSTPHLMRGCPSILTHIAITPDEEYLACCGLTVGRIPDLHIGNAHTDPLSRIVQNVDQDLLRLWIRMDGPERIVDFLQQRDASIEYPYASVHQCQTCKDLFSREDLRGAMLKHASEKESEIVFRYHLWQETDRYISQTINAQESVHHNDTSHPLPSLIEKDAETSRLIGSVTFPVTRLKTGRHCD